MLDQKSARQRLSLLLSALFVLSLLAGALPRPALAAAVAECEDTHIVVAGETIYRIARDYEVKVARLAKANNLTKPYRLTVGQSLCIPGIPEPSSKYKWSASFTGEEVTITGSGFKKSYTFFVRARENDSAKFYKLGKFASNKSGEVDKDLKVPKDLQKKPYLMICLKDTITDYLDCKQVWRR